MAVTLDTIDRAAAQVAFTRDDVVGLLRDTRPRLGPWPLLDRHRWRHHARRLRRLRHLAPWRPALGRPEVVHMLAGEEYREICRDYDQLSAKWFPKSHRPPPKLRFNNSPALFPIATLRPALAADYTEQCELLFPNTFVPFDDVLDRFEHLRELL
jgi:hypothetical protein